MVLLRCRCKMNDNHTKTMIESQNEFGFCGNLNGHFRRTSSLRLRGEKMVQRSPLQTKNFIPAILENTHNNKFDDDTKLYGIGHRQRSYSFHVNNTAKLKSCLQSGLLMDKKKCDECANTPPVTPEDLPDDESLQSYGSAATAASVDVNYAPFNGTTFSGRSMRYVLHCSSHAGLIGDEYLTPTQRAQKQIRKLKNLLSEAKKDLNKKDSEIFLLTKEVVELRLYKASLCSPDEKSNSSEIVTIKENAEENTPELESPKENFDATDGSFFNQTPSKSRNEMHGSFTDSGHYDDLTNLSLHSKDSVHVITQDASTETEDDNSSLIAHYEKKIEDLIRNNIEEIQDLKKNHNDKVEALLLKLTDVNSRYCDLLPNYEQAKEKIHILEKKLEEISKQLQEEENKLPPIYQNICTEVKDAQPSTSQSPISRVSVEGLLEQLQITQNELENVRDTAFSEDRAGKSHALLSAKEAVSLWVLGARKAMYRRIVESQKSSNSKVDPEVKLQFLKSAVYYFLTDTENHHGHLNAIENILGFSEAERKNIRKARPN